MRRGCCINIAGKGAKGYNKPPPAPLSQINGNRMRLHTHDANGTNTKDRLGSSREHSPNIGVSGPTSPLHLNSREKSPKDASQILQDCSMCISAYIQSLNTVCGTACRLAQCLAQVDLDNGSNESSAGSGLPLFLLKDAAESWEGVARLAGNASANAKNQMLLLLQDAQAKQTLEFNESVRKSELTKVMRTVLASFLSLQCQFSLVVIERFSGMLQHLKDENDVLNSVTNDCCPLINHEGGGGNWSSFTLSSQHHSSSSPPKQKLNYSHLLPHQPIQEQQLIQQQLAMQHQNLLQQVLLASNKNSPLNGVSCLSEESGNEQSSSSINTTFQPSFLPAWVTSQLRSSQYSGILSSGLYTSEEIDNLSENLARRWSMGCSSTFEDGCQKLNSLDPFSLIANRRWSVPETTEYDSASSGFWDLYSFTRCNYSGSLASGKNSQNRSFNKETSQMISRESSCTRSSSHSRSATPDQSRRVSVVSSEELQDIVDLLSFPLLDEKCELLLSSVGKGLCQNSNLKDDFGNAFHQRICEVNADLLSPSDPLCVTGINDIWVDTGSEKEDSKSLSCIQERRSNKERVNQISTSLWPPTDSVPGVTLTECVGETEKHLVSPWSGCDVVPNCCMETSNAACLNRDSVSRASWPISSLSSFASDLSAENLKGSREGWPSRPNVATFRRHSTDAPCFLSQGHQSPLLTKTRSFENIASKLLLCNGTK